MMRADCNYLVIHQLRPEIPFCSVKAKLGLVSGKYIPTEKKFVRKHLVTLKSRHPVIALQAREKLICPKSNVVLIESLKPERYWVPVFI